MAKRKSNKSKNSGTQNSGTQQPGTQDPEVDIEPLCRIPFHKCDGKENFMGLISPSIWFNPDCRDGLLVTMKKNGYHLGWIQGVPEFPISVSLVEFILCKIGKEFRQKPW